MYQLLITIYLFFQLFIFTHDAQREQKRSVSYELAYSYQDSTYVSPATLEISNGKSTFYLDDSLSKTGMLLSHFKEIIPFNIIVRDFNRKEVSGTNRENYRLDKLPWKDIHWDIKEEFKTIGEYLCQLAIAECNNNIYWVWYTEEIPISAGPGLLFGLPGLIVEAELQNGVFKVELKKEPPR